MVSPAVYMAGRDCGWHFLSNTVESKAFPPFSGIYQRYCEMVLAGEQLVVEKPEALPETSLKPATKKQALAQLDNLKKLTGLIHLPRNKFSETISIYGEFLAGAATKNAR